MIDDFERDDLGALKSLYYADPATGQETLDEARIGAELDLASYRVVKTSVGHFGTSAEGLSPMDSKNSEAVALDLLARLRPEDLQDRGDEVVVVPPEDRSPGLWPHPIYFRQVGNDWKIDIGRTLRYEYKIVRINPVAGESKQQTLDRCIHEVAEKYNVIADDIDKGKITDVIAVQARMDEVFVELASEYRQINLETLPR
jgi:hypothetical protein